MKAAERTSMLGAVTLACELSFNRISSKDKKKRKLLSLFLSLSFAVCVDSVQSIYSRLLTVTVSTQGNIGKVSSSVLFLNRSVLSL